jgi:O-antigen/teichoic acid export membrane protein
MFMSVLKGIQRMDKSNSLEIKSSLINAVGTALVLEMGLGLFGLALNSLVCACIALFLGWWTVRRVIPEVSLTWGLDGGLLRDMLRYGSKIQISRLGSHICFQLDKPVISMFLGIGAVSFYEIGARLANFLRAVPLVMISALIPVTSELDARNEKDRILQTYYVVSRYVAMVTIAVVAFAILELPSLVTLWVGQGFSESVLIAQVLVIGYGINILGGAASQTGAGIGRPEFDMRATLLLSIVNPILSITLVQWFGAAGAATGTSVALALSSMYLLATFQRNYVERSLWSIVRAMHLKPLIAAMAASTAVLGAHSLLPDVAAWANQRYLLPMKLAVDFWTFVPTYVIVLVALRQITAIDWKNFLGLISFGFEFIRHPLRERVNIYR